MWQTYIFGMHWEHEGKMYYDEIPAESIDEAANYFNHHKRDDVTLVRVEVVRPGRDDHGVREPAHPSNKPFSPLQARRRMDKDEDAR